MAALNIIYILAGKNLKKKNSPFHSKLFMCGRLKQGLTSAKGGPVYRLGHW